MLNHMVKFFMLTTFNIVLKKRTNVLLSVLLLKSDGFISFIDLISKDLYEYVAERLNSNGEKSSSATKRF